MATILIVDDQDVNRQYLTTLLGYGGHRVLEAVDGAGALAQVRAEKPDLVIADILMPAMDGYEFVHQLRSDPEIARTAVIFCSAIYQEREARALAESCGVRYLLTKPAEPETVLETVNAALSLPPSAPRPGVAEDFDRRHSRLLTDKLYETINGLQTANARLAALLEIARQLASERDPGRLLEKLCPAAREILGCCCAAAALFREDDTLGSLAASGTNAAAEARARDFFSGSPLPRQVLAEGRPLRLGEGADALAAQGLSPFLGVPMSSPDGPRGVLFFLGKLDRGDFTPEDEQVASAIAAQAAVACENALHYAHIRRHAAELEREVVQRREAEEALREREERFRALFEEAPVGTALVALDNSFLRVNNALCQMLGYTGEELLKVRFRDLTHPDDVQASVEQIGRLVRGEIPTFHMEKRYLRKDGQVVWGAATVVLIRKDGTPLHLLSVVENITGRKGREQQISNLNGELEQRVAELTALNKELGAFTYSISHDLRAPLRHIDAFSKILLDEAGPKLDPASQGFLHHIREGSQQMARMIDDLLDLARTGRREPDKVLTGLDSLVGEALRVLAPEFEGRQIEWRIGKLPFADCDPALVKQVFVNVLSNAVKFTRPRKVAVIEVGHLPDAAPPVVFVRDNGVGFSMKYAGKLFGVFQRLHRHEDFEGTGVGLAIAQRIIQKHGGRIWAEAELDQGAAFYFTLEPGG